MRRRHVNSLAVHRISKLFLIALGIVLLIDQSFAIEHIHASALVMVDQHEAPARENNKPRDAGSHCGHGCHLQNHFLGHTAQDPARLMVFVDAARPVGLPATRWVTATLDPPYIPPRSSPHA